MADALLTRPSLLVRLRDPRDGSAWQQFIELYGGLIYGFVRKRGLQDADAADLTQEVLQDISKTMGRWQYDPTQGTFRGWLFALTRNKFARFLKRRKNQPIGSGDSGAQERLGQEISPDGDSEKAWDQEYEQQLFRLAADQIRDSFAPATWQAFWQTAVEGKSGSEVAAALGMSVGAVYVAKSRIMTRLAEQVRLLQEDQ
jgi:RNA polymerase sigma-70 factor (ECF subfamily)